MDIQDIKILDNSNSKEPKANIFLDIFFSIEVNFSDDSILKS